MDDATGGDVPDWPTIFTRIDALRRRAEVEQDAMAWLFWRDVKTWFNGWFIAGDWEVTS